jgi:hypothetical protein
MPYDPIPQDKPEIIEDIEEYVVQWEYRPTVYVVSLLPTQMATVAQLVRA